MAWFDERLSAFDVESSGVDVENDRIVQSAIVSVGAGEPTRRSVLLINPGVPIPPEATEIHGITDAKVQAEGVSAHGAIGALAQMIRTIIDRGRPLIVQNAPFDLTMLDRECRRHGHEPPDWSKALIFDPLPVDRWADQFRRSYPYGHTPESAAEAGILSSRSLGGMCAHYGVELDDAHAADADALGAARLAYRMLHRSDFVQGRHPEIIARRAMWKGIREDLGALQIAQSKWRAEQSDSLRAWFEKQGETEKAASVSNDWPWIPMYEFEAKVEH